jgi:hypothetical protein
VQEQSNLFFCIAALLTIVAASLFALQTDDRENSFQVSRGEAFYIQVSIGPGNQQLWRPKIVCDYERWMDWFAVVLDALINSVEILGSVKGTFVSCNQPSK